MVTTVLGITLASAQVEHVEYEMLEVVRPRPERGYSNCADINDSNVAVANSGGERLSLSGGAGSVMSWLWKDGQAKRIKGVGNYVVAMQIDADGTVATLLARPEGGVTLWHPGFARDGQTYTSPLDVPFLDYLRPYDHSGGLSGVVTQLTEDFDFRQVGTEAVRVPTRSGGPGASRASAGGTIEVPKYEGHLTRGVHFLGGFDKAGTWVDAPVQDAVITCANRMGQRIWKEHSRATLMRPTLSIMSDWHSTEVEGGISYPWNHWTPDGMDATADVTLTHMNDQGWVTFFVRSAQVLFVQDGQYPRTDALEYNLQMTGTKLVTGGYVVTNAGTIRIPDFGGAFSFPLGLNDGGEAVGTAATKAGPTRGLLFKKGVTYDLNDVTFDRHGWVINSANAINNNGWVAATAVKGKQYAAFVLRPLKQRSIKRVARMAGGATYDGVLGAKIDR